MNSLFLSSLKAHMYSKRLTQNTINTYLYWVKYFINFNDKRHPSECYDEEVTRFFNHLPNIQNISQQAQATAKRAIFYLYQEFLQLSLSRSLYAIDTPVVDKKPIKLTSFEMSVLIAALPAQYKLPCQLMNACGLQTNEVVRLRVKDIALNHAHLQVCKNNGEKRRCVALPDELVSPLKAQIKFAVSAYHRDLRNPSYQGVYLSQAEIKEFQSASQKQNWQYIFPANRLRLDPAVNKLCRYHLPESAFKSAIQQTYRTLFFNNRL